MKRKLPILFFLFITTVIIISWFKDGLIYGGGDAGLQTYNPSRILDNAGYIWWEATGPGSPIPQGLSAIPFQALLYPFQLLGFSPLFLQAITFFALLFLMGYGTYLYLDYKLDNKNRPYSITGALFYMLNPYMMIQVWHRFIHTTIVLAAVLPLLALFWSKWIKEGSKKHFLLFLLVSFLASYLFGTYAYIVVVWVFLFLLSLIESLPIEPDTVFKIIRRFIFGFILWLLISSWWLFPVVSISPALLSTQHNQEESIINLIGISAQEILPFSMQLINPFYLFSQGDFGPIYNEIFMKIIPWIFVGVILSGFLYSFKSKGFALFGFCYLISIFLAKGAAPPFGNLYIFGFENIFAIGILRNPFEKTGLILVLFATVLFTLGIINLSKFVNKKITIPLLIIMMVIFCWPMFAGNIFGNLTKSAFVKVPEEYLVVDKWLNQQKEQGLVDGKILHLPLIVGESISYKWQYGYNGLEPSDTFFTSHPSISKGFNIQQIDDSLRGFSKTLILKLNKERILKYLQEFNIRFVVLHKDVVWEDYSIEDPFETERFLDNLIFLKKQITEGNLVVYKLEDTYFEPKIVLKDKAIALYPGEEDLTFIPSLFKSLDQLFITSSDQKNIKESLPQEMSTLIFPKNSFIYGVSSESGSLNVSLQQLNDLKQNLLQSGMLRTHSFIEGLIELNNLLDLILIKKQNPNLDIISDLDKYKKVTENIFSQDFNLNLFQSLSTESPLTSIFRSHLLNIENLLKLQTLNPQEREVLTDIFNSTVNILREYNLFPQHYINEIQSKYFKFEIPEKNEYEIIAVLASGSILDKTDLYINGQKWVVDLRSEKDYLTLGKVQLDKNTYEFSYPRSASESHKLLLRKEVPVESSTSGSVIEFKKDNAVSYKGKLNIQKPTFLVLKETYHHDWELTLLNKDKKMKVDKHVVADLYANGWYIDKVGEYEFSINFTGQRTFNFGLALTVFGILITLGYFIVVKKV